MKNVVLITGASSGFGYFTALTLLQKGHKVYASMRDVEGKNLAAAQALSGAGAAVLSLDVTDETSIRQAIDTLVAREGRLDVLINNAGVACAGVSESFDAAQFSAMLDVNLVGMFRVTQAALPTLRQQQRGLIINIGSILGRVNFPFFSLYGATKHAVEALSEGMKYELSQLGVDVVLVQPSAFPTSLYSNLIAPAHGEVSQSYGAANDIVAGISNTIAQSFEGAQAPDPQEVAEGIVNLINTPAGQRPARQVVGASFGADTVNEQVAPTQAHLLEMMQLSGLAELKV